MIASSVSSEDNLDHGYGGSVGLTAIGRARKVNLTAVTGAGDNRAKITVDADKLGLLQVSNENFFVDSTATVIWDGTTADPFAVVTNGLGGCSGPGGGGHPRGAGTARHW